MNPPTTKLDEEEYVECLQPGCFNSKEVAGQQLLSLLAQERPPTVAFLGPLGSRRDILAFEDISDSGATDPVAQLE